ncbi:HepT-like ribonuclease domain-containing protein [Dyadobacter fanqingshengii]|uniref:DUF86 domain-containing protein n=1 Tax=Dyadobacter fanqingshengii TaxID=2906443 RepID=A0A9X1P4B2_9BACT|nr:HepT-like ribonuclease domain-containing protein [Dyadobacter fanqingshengii]MCF0038649.1 DUF86 domain-containing protein [Dyadobacter fanqingshengii]USJ34518.1 DUF86 domain-containing protein [Dyadobacter fanqingshengii]
MKEAEYDKVRLLHILEAINYIGTFIEGKIIDDLYKDPMLRFAIERQLEIIGEATNHLSENLKSDNPEIEWRKVTAFRNFIIHEYFGVDLELVWDIVINKISPL